MLFFFFFSAYTEVEMSDASRLFGPLEPECSTVWSGSLASVVRNIGISSTTQCSHWNAIFLAICRQDCCEKEDWKRSWCKKVGRTYSGGNVFMFTDIRICRRHKMVGRENPAKPPCMVQIK